MMDATMNDRQAMDAALAEARLAAEGGEVPIGAVMVYQGVIIAHAQNCVIRHVDPAAHAEIIAMRTAARALSNYRLNGCTLYVTLEPCAMCAGAMIHAVWSSLPPIPRPARAGRCSPCSTIHSLTTRCRWSRELARRNPPNCCAVFSGTGASASFASAS